MLDRVSVIVPLAPGDSEWRNLAQDLAFLPAGTELILAGPEKPADLEAVFGSRPVRWVDSPRDRARQLNLGAGAASREFLWFLHADTRFAPAALRALSSALDRDAQALHYFELGFFDGPALMRLNTHGVRWRVRRLGTPFGDQGYCLRRELFDRLGRFPENAPFGEDHLLVWEAHKRGVPVRSTGGRLLTSARKYREQGWLKTTLTHMWLGTKQALPHWLEVRRRS